MSGVSLSRASLLGFVLEEAAVPVSSSMGSEARGLDVMLELAAEAFRARNFQLAADIYQCQLRAKQPGETEEMHLKRAHCLVLGGRLSEALEEYQLLSQQGRLRAEHLDVLVGYLAESMRGSQGWAEGEPPGKGLLSCLKCTGTLFEPVTLRCGHSYCKSCLEKERESHKASNPSCKLCKEKLPTAGAYRINVILNSFLGKYFPAESRALTLRHEGNVLYKKNKPLAALEKYHEAIALAPKDHLLLSNRAQINTNMKYFEDALRDGNAACSIQPFWPKGHLRKAQALAGLQKKDKALKEYLICIALDSENKTAKMEAQKILCDLLSPIAENMHQRLPDIMQVMSPRSRIKGIVLNSLNSRNSSNVFENSCKVSVSTAGIDPKQEWKAHSYCNLTKPAQGISNNQDTLKNLSNELALTTSEKKNALKTKHNPIAEDKPGTTECYNKCTKRARLQSPSREHDVLPKLVDAFDLECSLCMRLYYEPITTPCGHTFCLKCIERCMDHSPKCPLCKEVLPEYQALRKYNRTVLIEELIVHYLPEELAERKRVNDEEMAELSNLNKAVPIFICTMAYPTVPCPLHIFEPRYRLMIRRCMETGNKQFGMCLSDPVKGFADYGCMLEVRSVELFSDGRSVVDTIGRRRFKVLRHSEKDGYSTADIEYLEDKKVEGEDYAELVRLHNLVYDQAYMWFSSLKQILKTRILSHFGPMPRKDTDIQASPNGPGWCWWLLAVLPLESRAQLPFLAMTSLQERLNGIRRVLLFMSRNCPR
ncbi:LON peptidase N-terminal domain and RING finger protein 3-like [Carcharodon carcharias]|uniref:LON peptidase N-terminal domain and RING finger protein 3-like n=1 Tax=Carcharodon carcharias TaxID=13397 RepID=UPI001B7E5C47|nr:LON peptidase N-terminal domain and RING finger protein 3-like [Carcharodon carcharias]